MRPRVLAFFCLLWLFGGITGSGSPAHSTPGPKSCPVSPHVIAHPDGVRLATPTGSQIPTGQFGLNSGAGTSYVGGPMNLTQKRATHLVKKFCGTSRPTLFLLSVAEGIDGNAPPLGYDTSRDPQPRAPIQPSGVYFPTEGCWEIGARAGNS